LSDVTTWESFDWVPGDEVPGTDDVRRRSCFYRLTPTSGVPGISSQGHPVDGCRRHVVGVVGCPMSRRGSRWLSDVTSWESFDWVPGDEVPGTDDVRRRSFVDGLTPTSGVPGISSQGHPVVGCPMSRRGSRWLSTSRHGSRWLSDITSWESLVVRRHVVGVVGCRRHDVGVVRCPTSRRGSCWSSDITSWESLVVRRHVVGVIRLGARGRSPRHG